MPNTTRALITNYNIASAENSVMQNYPFSHLNLWSVCVVRVCGRKTRKIQTSICDCDHFIFACLFFNFRSCVAFGTHTNSNISPRTMRWSVTRKIKKYKLHQMKENKAWKIRTKKKRATTTTAQRKNCRGKLSHDSFRKVASLRSICVNGRQFNNFTIYIYIFTSSITTWLAHSQSIAIGERFACMQCRELWNDLRTAQHINALHVPRRRTVSQHNEKVKRGAPQRHRHTSYTHTHTHIPLDYVMLYSINVLYRYQLRSPITI